MRLIFAGLICFFFIPVTFANTEAAEQIVRKTTMEVLERLETDRDTLATHPEHIQVVVRDLITPHFDFNTMTRLALGDYWKNISESRQSCLISGFRNLLVERYADILLGYNNQMITYEAVGPVGERDFVKIRQTITRDGARPLPIDYPLHPDNDSWKVADIVIDGVSLVRNYRGIFRYEIDRYGLESFIKGFPECSDTSP